MRVEAAAEHVDPAAAGRAWQPSVLAEVARLSLVTGDTVEETGDSPAHGRSKRETPCSTSRTAKAAQR